MEEEKREEKEQEKTVYYRIRNADGTETSDIVAESVFSKMLGKYEIVEENDFCKYLRARE